MRFVFCAAGVFPAGTGIEVFDGVQACVRIQGCAFNRAVVLARFFFSWHVEF